MQTETPPSPITVEELRSMERDLWDDSQTEEQKNKIQDIYNFIFTVVPLCYRVGQDSFAFCIENENILNMVDIYEIESRMKSLGYHIYTKMNIEKNNITFCISWDTEERFKDYMARIMP